MTVPPPCSVKAVVMRPHSGDKRSATSDMAEGGRVQGLQPPFHRRYKRRPATLATATGRHQPARA
eukprot:9321317-Alexandrium_andersonii.AAC.1